MDQDQGDDKNLKMLTSVAVLVVVVVLVVGVKVFSLSKRSNQNTGTTALSATRATTNSHQIYKDGTYTATGSYESPGGTEAITVSVTLKGNIVAATSATSGASDPTAQEFQDAFIQGYKRLVVGKDLNNVGLTKVSGSSLTSQGFADALAQIELRAKA